VLKFSSKYLDLVSVHRIVDMKVGIELLTFGADSEIFTSSYKLSTPNPNPNREISDDTWDEC
jgi:hypothetical protein